MRPHLWGRLRLSIRLSVALLLLTLLVSALGRRHGDVPALGPLLDPFHGIWAHRSALFERKPMGGTELRIRGLKGRVEIHVDEDQVKHIFAERDEDLYLAQGYVVASDRLWQMDFLTRVAGGRLSEILGRKALEFDRLFIRLGIPQVAKESAELMLQDPITGPALRAYAEGVNAYIQSLGVYDLPFEYKLLGHRPEPWTPYHAALLMKFMSYNLSFHSSDLPLSRSFAKLGAEDFEDLFSLGLPIPEPIVPRGSRWNIQTPSPAPPAEAFQVQLQKLEPHPTPHPSNGSNNWAVTGKKSTTGLPILSNDIHLSLSLPSLWYEMQLVSPSQNVYGVTLPGSPGIILGFNSKLAWGVTNGQSDVLDWYELRFRDENKNEYLFAGDWRPVISQEVLVPVRGEKPEIIITRRTHFGPIVYDDNETPVRPQIPKGLAMRWAALEPSQELRTFLLLNRAQSTEQCREAISTFRNPGQNFLCADNRDDVGLWHMGAYPLRWKGQGRTISDGSSSDYEWKGWIPVDELPSVRNPDRGFVSSANQSPVDETYPHYLGWPFEYPFRAMRINEILRSKAKFSPEDIIRMQADTLNIPARTLVPRFLNVLRDVEFDKKEKDALTVLSKWDFRFEEDSTGAPIFQVWMKQIEAQLWGPRLSAAGDFMYPPKYRMVLLLEKEESSKWFDDPSTPEVETLRDVLKKTLPLAVQELQKVTGSSKASEWTWASYRPTQFPHAGKIPGLGEVSLSARGQEHTIFANNGSHGPVWKLVVALGRDKPRAWGVYPGGQSGDPTSAYYDNFLQTWRAGELKELMYLSSADEANPRLKMKWVAEDMP